MKNNTHYYLIVLMIFYSLGASGQDQDDEKTETKRKIRYGTHRSFSIDLGINNWLEEGEFPSDNNAVYAVRPWGSWYVGLNMLNDTHISGPLHVEWGVGVNWYNFKFEDEHTRITEGADQVVFYTAPLDTESDKSKLTAAFVNASLVPMLKLSDRGRRHRHHHHWDHWHGFDNRGGFRIGAGGYVGYKIDSYTKVIVDDDKDRDHDGFYLNNIRYGIRGQVGFRGLDLFVNYDLNELFVENKGPKLQAFSFGVIL